MQLTPTAPDACEGNALGKQGQASMPRIPARQHQSGNLAQHAAAGENKVMRSQLGVTQSNVLGVCHACQQRLAIQEVLIGKHLIQQQDTSEATAQRSHVQPSKDPCSDAGSVRGKDD